MKRHAVVPRPGRGLCAAAGLALVLVANVAFADDGRPVLVATRISTPPAIDGSLDDDAWRGGPVQTGEWLSYNPLHGTATPQKTRVWIRYDAGYLYFAFQADDPEPDRIKSSITRRDNMWTDDWVGLSLDSLGTGQTSYHLMVNPSGIQGDLLNTVAGEEDSAPDFVWDSAGRINANGYAVEIRIPLQTIRFRGGEPARMGILFWRRVSRLGVSTSWPPLEPGKWVFEMHASLIFPSLDAVRTRELNPATTVSSRQDRAAPDRWRHLSTRGDVGLGAKMGLTSTVTLDATINPDFSQVESDTFQVEVNQRYPVFYSEKRPFFMEGAGLFTLAGSHNDSSMMAAVDTRHIVDPKAGFKITGSVGPVLFGTLSAVDEATGRLYDAGDPRSGRRRVFNVARAQYSLGPSNYIGAIATDTRFAGTVNQVGGGDLSWRATPNQRLTGMALYSRSTGETTPATTEGFAGLACWSYATRTWAFQSQIEHYDPGFRMDTAFYNRVGFTSGWGYGEWSFYPDPNKHPWLRRIQPFIWSQHGHDRVNDGAEAMTVPGIRLRFTRQGFLRIDKRIGFEPWQGRRFPISRPHIEGELQLFRWIRMDGNAEWGDAIYYDEASPFAGWMRTLSLNASWQPTTRVTQTVGYKRVDFRRAGTRALVYDLDIVNTRTTFQFTKQISLRAIAQYDSLQQQVLADVLASYEPRPGTVAYAGYGALYERRGFVDGAWQPARGAYLATQRGLFLKASYLYRF